MTDDPVVDSQQGVDLSVAEITDGTVYLAMVDGVATRVKPIFIDEDGEKVLDAALALARVALEKFPPKGEMNLCPWCDHYLELEFHARDCVWNNYTVLREQGAKPAPETRGEG